MPPLFRKEANLQLADLANLSTVITGVVAILAFIGAIWQVFASKRSQREATASELCGSYLELAVEYPLLAKADDSLFKDTNSQEFEQYEWFVSVMLHACERILDLAPEDEVWRKAIQAQITYHNRYIASSRFERDFYDPELRAMFPTHVQK